MKHHRSDRNSSSRVKVVAMRIIALVILALSAAQLYADTWQNCNNIYIVNKERYDSYGNYMKIDYGICLQIQYYDYVNGMKMYPWIFVMAVHTDPNELAGWRVTASGVTTDAAPQCKTSG